VVVSPMHDNPHIVVMGIPSMIYGIQRAISRRVPLPEVLQMIVAAAGELLGDEIVGLWRLVSRTHQGRPVTACARASAAARGQPGWAAWSGGPRVPAPCASYRGLLPGAGGC